MFSTGGAEGITEVKMSVWFLLVTNQERKHLVEN